MYFKLKFENELALMAHDYLLEARKKKKHYNKSTTFSFYLPQNIKR